jgi:hypothetical protein
VPLVRLAIDCNDSAQSGATEARQEPRPFGRASLAADRSRWRAGWQRSGDGARHDASALNRPVVLAAAPSLGGASGLEPISRAGGIVDDTYRDGESVASGILRSS